MIKLTTTGMQHKTETNLLQRGGDGQAEAIFEQFAEPEIWDRKWKLDGERRSGGVIGGKEFVVFAKVEESIKTKH